MRVQTKMDLIFASRRFGFSFGLLLFSGGGFCFNSLVLGSEAIPKLIVEVEVEVEVISPLPIRLLSS